MSRAGLQRQISEKRQLMFDEGFLNDGFLRLEEWEERRPHFVETIINYYIPSSTEYIQQLGEILVVPPLNMPAMEHLILNLKGASSRQVVYNIYQPQRVGLIIGAGKLIIAIDELLPLFKIYYRIDARLGAALRKVINEHTALKVHLIAYIEMLKQMRINYGDEDSESVGSNNGND